MTLIKVAVWLLVHFLLLRGSKQQACSPEPYNLACSPPGGSCIQDVDFTGLQGKTIVLTRPGTYRLNQTAQLSEDSVVTCINGSTPDAGSYNLGISPFGALHFAITGTGASLVLQSLTVQGNAAFVSNVGGISMSSSSNLILSSVLYQNNAQPITTTGAGAKLTVTDTSFNNNANRMGPGGAIFASEDSGLAVTTITFNGNNSFDSNSATLGGAIYIQNNVLVNQPTGGSMTFSRNQATCISPGCGGGAICMSQTRSNTQPQVNLTNAEFVQNTATRGGAVLMAGGQLTMQSLTNNGTAFNLTGNAAGSSGGAICVQGFAGTSAQGLLPDPVLIVSDAAINSNKVLNSPSGLDTGSGGAIYAGANASVMVTNSAFISNAAYQGGAVATRGALFMDNCQFDSHDAPGNGGAILGATNAVITVRDCSFSGNRASNGGAIIIDASTLHLQSVVASTVFSLNSAVHDGGAIYASNSLVNMTSESAPIKFDNNNAETLGGAIAAIGGGQLYVNNVGFYQNNGSYGGALYLNGMTANIYQATFQSNQAIDGGAIYGYKPGDSTAIHIGDVNKPSWRTFMRNNSASNRGGAVFLGQPLDSDMAAVCFTGNKAGAQLGGGAMFIFGLDSGTQLQLFGGLQSFGGNTAAGSSNALTVDYAIVNCAKGTGDGIPSTYIPTGAYNIEGFICTDYASSPTVNTCPAGAQNCTCPVNSTFDTSQCACSGPPPKLVVSIAGLPPTADVGAVVNATLTVAGSGTNGSILTNVRLTVDIPQGLTASGSALPTGCSLVQDSSSPVAVVACVIGNATVGGSPYTATLQLTANQAVTAQITASATGTGVDAVGTQSSVDVLGACCNADQGGTCSYTAAASNCSALNPANTFFDTSNCSTACAEPPEAISLGLLRTARSPKTAEVGRDVRVLMVVTAPKASAVNVTATLVIPNNLKFLSINPPDCTFKQQIITCQPFHTLRQGRSRQFVIATTSLSAGNATISATVSRPGGEVEGQSSLTIPILGGCCNNQSSTPCSATTARDCKKAGGKFYKTKSCRALKKACSIDKAGG